MSEPLPEIDAAVQRALARHAGIEGALLPVLQSLQQELGHVPASAVPAVAGALNLSRAEVHGVLSFYEDLRTAPGGERRLQICRAEACQALGARALEAHATQRLGIGFGEVTADGRIALEAVYCLGNCACGPAVRLGDEVYGRVTPGRFDELLAGACGEPA